jgi:hypothetical protein
MKYLTLRLAMAIAMAGTSICALTNQPEEVVHDTDQAIEELALIESNLLKNPPAITGQETLADVYEYEEASIKILKYFGVPAMTGMIAALGCFILVIQD